MSLPDHPSEAWIDLSKVARLKDVTLHFEDLSVAWVASTLKTITSGHRDLREVSIKGLAPINAAAVEDDMRGEWVNLERTLIQLWESHAICAKVKYYSGKGEESRELMEDLLPETTRRGIVELVYISAMYYVGRAG